MKLEFDPQADAAYLEISDAEIETTKQLEPGIIVDYDAQGQIVGIEVLSISKRTNAPLKKVAELHSFPKRRPGFPGFCVSGTLQKQLSQSPSSGSASFRIDSRRLSPSRMIPYTAGWQRNSVPPP